MHLLNHDDIGQKVCCLFVSSVRLSIEKNRNRHGFAGDAGAPTPEGVAHGMAILLKVVGT